MKNRIGVLPVFLTAIVLFSPAVLAQDGPENSDTAVDTAELYDLAYKFNVGETLRWEVIHKLTVQTTIEGTTETAKTRSESVKAWKVTDVTPEGIITFVNSVESVKMTKELSDRAEVEYDSQRDAVPPAGYEATAKVIGVPLTMFRINSRGKLLRREPRHAQSDGNDSTPVTVRLPDSPVAIGATWTQPFDVVARLKNGNPRPLKARQRMELESVADGIATIAVDFQILDPAARHDPNIMVQVMHRLSRGKVRLDIEAGRIISQEMTIDERVLGFSGASSSMHHLMSFSERILKANEKVAKKPPRPIGPQRDTSLPADRGTLD